jgi:hypothetical protein
LGLIYCADVLPSSLRSPKPDRLLGSGFSNAATFSRVVHPVYTVDSISCEDVFKNSSKRYFPEVREWVVRLVFVSVSDYSSLF